MIETLEPGLRRIVAPNPSPMTERGTNTYLLGRTDLAVIDPGPALPDHLQAILGAVAPDQRISHILVTHAHLDHSPLAAPLAEATGAPVYAFGPAVAGRSAVMAALARDTGLSGGEGIDAAFAPDVTLAEGEVLRGAGWEVEVLWTPGHLSNHISFAWDGAVFTGDHVMGWASSLVSPPDGDLTQFMASCRRLAARTDRIYYPGHGAPVAEPAQRIAWLIEHRRAREAQVLDVLGRGPATPAEITRQIYTETPPALLKAAERNVLAHLIDLTSRQKLRPAHHIHPGAIFEIISS